MSRQDTSSISIAMEIEFDPAKAAANKKKHDVSFADAEQVLRDEFALTIEDEGDYDEQRFLTLGMDALGRILVVCHDTARRSDAPDFRSQSQPSRGQGLP